MRADWRRGRGRLLTGLLAAVVVSSIPLRAAPRAEELYVLSDEPPMTRLSRADLLRSDRVFDGWLMTVGCDKRCWKARMEQEIGRAHV